MTVEAWVYPTALGAKWRTAVLKPAPQSLAYGVYVNDNLKWPAGYVRTTASIARRPQ